MTTDSLDAEAARSALYDVMQRDDDLEEKAEAALSIGERFLGVDNGHLARVDTESAYWQSIVSTDDQTEQFPVGQTHDVGVTFCRHTVATDGPIAFHDARETTFADDPAFETHELHCYHGTALIVNGEVFGTVCFVSSDPRAEPFSPAETMFAELVTRLLEHELQSDRLRARSAGSKRSRTSSLTTCGTR